MFRTTSTRVASAAVAAFLFLGSTGFAPVQEGRTTAETQVVDYWYYPPAEGRYAEMRALSYEMIGYARQHFGDMSFAFYEDRSGAFALFFRCSDLEGESEARDRRVSDAEWMAIYDRLVELTDAEQMWRGTLLPVTGPKVVRAPMPCRFVLHGGVAIDVGESYDLSPPASEDQRAVLLLDGKRQSAEEIAALHALGLQGNLIVAAW